MYQGVLDLIGDIYEASFNPRHWDVALGKLCEIVKARSAGLFITDHKNKAVSSLHFYNVAKPAVLAYNAGFARIDPAFRIMAQQREGEPKVILNPDEPDFAHGHYHTLVLKQANIYYLAGINIFNNDEWHVGLGLHRSKEQGLFDTSALAILKDLLPHFQRAVRFQKEFCLLRSKVNTLEHAMCRMPFGVMIVDKFAGLYYANALAEKLLNHHPALALKDGKIRANDSKQNQQLCAMIEKVSRPSGLLYKVSAQVLGLTHAEKPFPLGVMLSPLADSSFSLVTNDDAASVLIVINDQESSSRISVESIVSIFGLTNAEARVAMGVINGLSRKQIAEQNRVSENTVSSQLKSVFSKTGVNRQADLVRLLLSGSVQEVELE